MRQEKLLRTPSFSHLQEGLGRRPFPEHPVQPHPPRKMIVEVCACKYQNIKLFSEVKLATDNLLLQTAYLMLNVLTNRLLFHHACSFVSVILCSVDDNCMVKYKAFSFPVNRSYSVNNITCMDINWTILALLHRLGGCKDYCCLKGFNLIYTL